jgi:ribosome-interacting GTPase 1
MSCLYVYNKIDQISLEEVDRLARMPHTVVIRYFTPNSPVCQFLADFEFFSCEMKLNLDYLLSSLWDHLNLIRVYTKKPGHPPDFDDAIILRNVTFFL